MICIATPDDELRADFPKRKDPKRTKTQMKARVLTCIFTYSQYTQDLVYAVAVTNPTLMDKSSIPERVTGLDWEVTFESVAPEKIVWRY